MSNNIIDIRLESVQYGNQFLWMGLDELGNLYMTKPRWGGCGVWGVGCRGKYSPTYWVQAPSRETMALVGVLSFLSTCCFPYPLPPTPYTLFLTYPAIEAILNYQENLARKKLASKKLKVLYQEHLKVGKISTRIVNKPTGFSIPKNGNVSAIAYEGFLQLVQYEVIQQNPVAINLVVAGLGDSLRTIAYSHFGIAINTQQRNQWLAVRCDGKLVRRELTDAIKSYLERHLELSDNYRAFIYINATNAMYRAVFGQDTKHLEEIVGCGRHQLRDYLDAHSLNRINNVEAALVAQIDNRDIEPLQAIKNVVEFLCLTPSQPMLKPDMAA